MADRRVRFAASSGLYRYLPVPAAWLACLRPGSRVHLTDARNARRTFVVLAVTEHGCWAESTKSQPAGEPSAARDLTAKDLKDLSFVAEYADVFEMSFANTARDVEMLQQHLARLGNRRRPSS